MRTLLAVVLSSSIAHAVNQPSLEVSFANYGWQLVDGNEDHAVALASFQWRLGHRWGGRRDTLAVALSYQRIRLHEKSYDRYGSGLFNYSPIFDKYTTFYPMSFEVRWTHHWGRSSATTLLLMPALTSEEFAGEDRYSVWGEFLVWHKGLGFGIGRLEVSGRLRWWPLISIRHQWRGIRVEGLFPRYLDVQKGLLKLKARLEGATYLIEEDWDTFQPLYFSQLDLGAALVVSEGPLAIAFEIGRTIHRRFEVAGSRYYQYQTIADGWYIRTSLRCEP